MMPDSERVIKGLGRCQIGCDYDCPYWTSPLGSTSICRSEMERDALALLKAQENEIEELKQEIEGHKDNLRETLDEMMRYADELKMQEPHIMTLEEWREWKRKPLSKRDPVYYVDNKGFGSWIGPNDQLFIYATPELGYGILFVCWTSRPTDEQMKTLMWE